MGQVGRWLTSLEACAGAGGQALGLEMAGFAPVMLIDNDKHACATLRWNRPAWDVRQMDLRDFVAGEHSQVYDVDLLSAGVPRTPYSVAGHQQGFKDSRDMLSAVVWLATEVRPRAIMIENVPTLLTDAKFEANRRFVIEELTHLGYAIGWRVLDAQDFGVPQARRSSILVAMKPDDLGRFQWPEAQGFSVTVAAALRESMGSRGWAGVPEWVRLADQVAPAIVGGSSTHGGADLGPTRTKAAWARLGVNGHSLGDDIPGPDFVMEFDLGKHGRDGLPKLTIPQVATLQGFPEEWHFEGGKTARYRQVAQAFPPPLAKAVGRQIAAVLNDPASVPPVA
ncbi:DNA cytosine methyltransferase [Streptosporangium amethystogenes subsp. fukuiense]|uniref:DNA (cytosine-5-)-methyltransferase n=1 Tax=Streptosporangium amethystogenes subsp. fukuiense TaxID=698418 RepID=A0ABW2TDA4_9ACTN